MRVIITPCLLGFDVKVVTGCFIHSYGIYDSFGKLAKDLMFTEEPFTVVLK